MKQLVICNNDLLEYFGRQVPYGTIRLYDTDITYALIETADLQWDEEQYPDHVLVRKKAFSSNYRDIGAMLAAAANINAATGDQILYYPIGSEFSGTVVAKGRAVRRFNIGDGVIPDASYPLATAPGINPGLPTNNASCELELFHESKLARIPGSLSFEEAAGFTIGAQTVYSMIERLAIEPGSKVLLLGLSANTALFALNVLKHMEVELYGVARSGRFREQLLEMGLKELFIAQEEDFSRHAAINAFIGRHGKFNYVIDPFSNYHLANVIGVIAMNGRYITCGLSNDNITENAALQATNLLLPLIINNITVMGNCLGTTASLEKALNEHAAGRCRVTVDKVWEQDPVGFMQRSFQDPERFGKVIFKF